MYYVYVCVLFSSRFGVPGKSAGVIFTPVNTEIVSFAPELVGGQCSEILHNQKHLNNTPYVHIFICMPFVCIPSGALTPLQYLYAKTHKVKVILIRHLCNLLRQ